MLRNFQTFSVFLVAILSITRALTLLLRKFIRKRFTVSIISVYGIFLLIRAIVLVATKYEHYYYYEQDVYCWPSSEMPWCQQLIEILNVVQLALPIVPILLSCASSTYIILASIRTSDQSSVGDAMKIKATITIIIVTTVYILCNIPVFMNQVLYTIHTIKYGDAWPGPYYSSGFMLNYSWGITGVVCVALNSAANPIIYFFRMKRFRAASVEATAAVSGFFDNMRNHQA